MACSCESEYSLSGKGQEATSWGVICVLLCDGLQFGLGPVIRCKICSSWEPTVGGGLSLTRRFRAIRGGPRWGAGQDPKIRASAQHPPPLILHFRPHSAILYLDQLPPN